MESLARQVFQRIYPGEPVPQDWEVLPPQASDRIAEVSAVDQAGHHYRVSVRIVTTDYPIDKIDCLEDPAADSGTHLIIVYLTAGETEIEHLPQRYVLANCWRSVTHVYWGEAHAFDVEVLPRPRCPETRDVKAKGGTRGQRDDFQISVITIVFNGESLLEQTLQAMIHQKTAAVEHILVDGGSTDGTLNLINRYGAYIDYWQSEPDQGLYDALNKGVSLCRGEWIGAIHANDCYARDALQKVQATIQSYPDAEFLYGDVNNVAEHRAWQKGREINSNWQMVTFGNFNHPTCFVRRSVYERIGGFDTRYRIAADYDFGIRAWKAGINFHYMAALIAHFRLGGTSANLLNNQWERHEIRALNGTSRLYSLLVLGLVLLNYLVKRPIRGWFDRRARAS